MTVSAKDLERRPCFKPFSRTRRLPAVLRGPVDRQALERLAASLAGVSMGDFTRDMMASFGSDSAAVAAAGLKAPDAAGLRAG